MPKKIKAYELDQVLELLSNVRGATSDIAQRLEVIYELGPELEERELDELGENLEAVDDVIKDFHYTIAMYMQGAGIEYEEEEEEEEEVSAPSALEKFLEEKLEWKDDPEEEESEDEEEVEEPYPGLPLEEEDDEEAQPDFLR